MVSHVPRAAHGAGQHTVGFGVVDELFEASSHDPVIADLVVPVKSSLTSADPDYEGSISIDRLYDFRASWGRPSSESAVPRL